jgi:dihydropteroate synthase
VPNKILFVTGRLAEPALRRTLAATKLPCTYDIIVMPISIAALMTTSWIARHFTLPACHPRHRRIPPDCDFIMIPGHCQGHLAEIEQACGLPVQKGPTDLQDIPHHFGQKRRREGYGLYDVQIIAEIQDALQLVEPALLGRAEYYRSSGADVVDLGITPGSSPATVARTVQLLKQVGYHLSVDSLDPAIIREADAAGVDYVLSLNSINLELGRTLRARPVVIPDEDGDVTSLWRNAEQLWAWGQDCILDPIIQPISFGFSRSLCDLYRTRERYPAAPLMMGTHHLSELTDADSSGINALLMGVAQELNLSFVLTTEVAPWARGSVRELDIARRLMHYAVNERVPPKRLEEGLLTVKESRLLRQDYSTLREMQAALTDPNFRIFIDEQQIYAFNADRFVSGTEIEAIFEQLEVDEAGHAFYLGHELTKARLALQLGKNYQQDLPLRWGYLTVEAEQQAQERHVRLTQRRQHQTTQPGEEGMNDH